MANEFISKILKVRKLPSDILIIRIEKPKKFEFKPGQFISIDVPSDEGIVRRPYSIASPDFEEYLELCIRKIHGGKGSEYLFGLEVGDLIKFFGPFGKFTYIGKKNEDVIFIALGVSITPIKSIVESLLIGGHNGKIILIRGARNEEDLPYWETFEKLKIKYKNFDFHNILSRPEKSNFENKGYVQEFILKFLPTNFFGKVYICGFFGVIEEITGILNKKNISGKRIFSEGHFKYAKRKGA